MPWKRAIAHDLRPMRWAQRVLTALALLMALGTCIAASPGPTHVQQIMLWTGLAAASTWTWAASKYNRDASKAIPLVLLIMTFSFLEDESLPVMAVSAVALTLSILAAGWSANVRVTSKTLATTLGKFLGLMILAVPIGILVFFIYPRTTLGFNQPGGQSTKAGMGLSSSMSPGSVSDLVQSNKLAFSASFYVETMEPSRLYWRATVLNGFDGTTWRETSQGGAARDPGTTEASNRSGAEAKPASQPQAKYRMDLPVTLGPYLPLLDSTAVGTARLEPSGMRLQINQSGGYGNGVPNPSALQVSAVAMPDSQWVNSSPPNSEDTTLPIEGNPKTRQMAKEWAMNEKGNALAIVDRFARHVRANQYYYTLKPPLWLPKDGIDHFFFDTRRGFCEHYASTFVYFLRAAGVPARVISGFQGGDVDGSDIRVLARDAHAWAEIWVEGRGWKRVDPTTFINPSRVEAQTRSLLERSIGLSALAQAWASKLEVAWNETILYYNGDAQMAFFAKWLSNPFVIVQRACAGALLLMLALVLRRAGLNWWAWRRMPDSDRLRKSYQNRLIRLESLGWPVTTMHTTQEVIEILRQSGPSATGEWADRPELQPWLTASIDWIEAYENFRYSKNPTSNFAQMLRRPDLAAQIFQIWLPFEMKTKFRFSRLRRHYKI